MPTLAAYLLGIGRTKLYSLIHDGSIRTVMLGGARRIARTETEWVLREGASPNRRRAA